jgi:hypothetical protein
MTTTPAHLTNHLTHASGRHKNVCTSAVLAHFGIAPSAYHYADEIGTVNRILNRHGYSVRSRRSQLPKRCSVGQARKAIAKFSGDANARYYVGVPGHALVLDGCGATVVDTDPRTRDHRQVLRIYAVLPST